MATDLGQLMHQALDDLQPPRDLLAKAVARSETAHRRRRISTRAIAVLAGVATAALILTIVIGGQDRAATAILIPTSPSAPATGVIPLANRRPAPDLSGRTVSGTPLHVTLAQSQPVLGGRPITVVTFFGSRCAPCRANSAQLNTAFEGYQSSHGLPGGISFYGVAERDSLADVRSYLARTPVNYPVLFDGDGKLGRSWNPEASLPYTVIVDSDGLIAAHFIGAVSADTLTKAIDGIDRAEAGPYALGEGALGLPSAAVSARTVKLAVENARCGNLSQLQFSVVAVWVQEDIAAVHVEVLAKPNPAAIADKTAQRACGYTGTKTITHTTVTLKTPLGNRKLLDDGGKAIPVQKAGAK